MRTAICIITIILWFLLSLISFIDRVHYHKDISNYTSVLLLSLLIIFFNLSRK